jgi:Ca2+-binding EF-hand superfamily protein
MSWETSSFASYASTLASVPEDPEVLAQDPIRMDKVHRKIKSMVMQRGPNGIPGFTRMWAEIDKTWNQRLTVWEFRKFFQTVDVKLNGKDLEALFIYHDHDGDGEVDYDEFLLALRNRFDMTQQQIEDILRKLKLRLLQRHKENPRAALEKALAAAGPQTLSRGQFIKALSSLDLGLSHSDFCFIFQHFSNVTDGPIPYIDAHTIVDDILLDLTADQLLDNLHQKMIDAMKDRDRTTSGSVGLLRVMKKLDADGSGWLPRDEFKRALRAYGCGIIDKEIDQCFDFYADPDTQQVFVGDFMGSMREAIGADDPPELLCYLFNKLRNILTYRGAQGIVALHSVLNKYSRGSGVVTLWQMVNAIRDLGVGGNLADVELEMMYNSVAESPDEMVVRKFVETVRGEVCEAKLDIINQAWGRLDPTDSGCCLFDNLANTFKPDRMPEVQSRRKSEKDMLSAFCNVFETPSGQVEKEMFLDFWCNYSVSVPDNKEFNLLMWNAFDLSKQPLSFKRQDPPMRGGYSAQNGVGAGAARRSGTAPPQSSQVEHAAVAPRVESASQRRLDMESVTSSGTYASRRTGGIAAPQRRPVNAAVPSTPPSANGRKELSPVPSPEISPDKAVAQAPPPQPTPEPSRQPPPAPASTGRGQTSWGGGRTSINVFATDKVAASVDTLSVTGSRGRMISESARRELHKDRPF